MKSGFGVNIPTSLREICAPERCGLIVYDMQVGIVPQIEGGAEIVSGCRELLSAARDAGLHIFFTRHIYLANRAAGVGQLRRAMVWQHKDEPEDTVPFFTASAAGSQIVPELAPREDEVVLEKITMSGFEGTYLDIAMRDARLEAFIIVGIALDVGIEPTVRHALDLNYIPVLVPELCGTKTI
jgi:biuret amidohydrolase